MDNRPNYRTNASKPVLQSIDSSNQISQTDFFEPIDEDSPEKECEEIVFDSFDQTLYGQPRAEKKKVKKLLKPKIIAKEKFL